MAHPIVTVEPFVYICMTGFFLSLVSTPQLILENRCTKHYNETTCQAMYKGMHKKNYDKIQEEAGLWIAAYKVVGNIITLFALPTVGTLSDVFGRHQAMFLIPLSLILRSSLMMLILKNGKCFETWLLLIVGPLPAIAGGVTGLVVFATAYISDITPTDQRTLRITLIDAASVMAAFTATLISGFIIESFGYIGIYAGVLSLMTLALLNWMCFIKPIKKHTGTGPTRPSITRIVSSYAHVESPATLSLLCSRSRIGSNVGTDGISTNKLNPLMEYKRQSISGGMRASKELQEGEDGSKDLEEDDTQTMEIMSYASTDEFEQPNKDDANEDLAKKMARNRPSHKQGLLVYKNTKIKHLTINDDNSCEENISQANSLHEVIKNSIQLKHNEDNEELNTFQCLKRNNILAKRHSNRANRKEFFKRLSDAANPFKNFLRILRAVKGTENIKLKIALLTITALATFSKTGELNVIIIFLRNYPFYLMPRDVGFLMAFQNGALAVIGLILFNTIFQRLCKIDDLAMILVSSSLSIIYFVTIALASSITVLYAIQILYAICFLNIPTVRAFLSKTSSTSTLGAVIGLVGMVETFSSVIACFAAPVVYSKLASVSTGAVFFIFALFMLVATVIIATLNFIHPKNVRKEELNQAIAVPCVEINVKMEGTVTEQSSCATFEDNDHADVMQV